MNPLDVLFRIRSIACHKKADRIGASEPYLWTVFFKIDGDTASIDDSLTLGGTATVHASPVSRADLGGQRMRAGDVVDVPALIGEYRTTLKPVLLTTPFEDHTSMPGGVGCVVALLEHDFSDEYEVAQAYTSLITAIQGSLNTLVPTLNLSTREIKAESSEAMHVKIRFAVGRAVATNVERWKQHDTWRNDDDFIGQSVLYHSAADLAANPSGKEFALGWNTNGDWEVKGKIVGTRVAGGYTLKGGTR